MLVLLSRSSDGKLDVYFEHGLQLDPADYAIGNGLGEWVEIEFETASLDVDAKGVRANVPLRRHASPSHRGSTRFVRTLVGAARRPSLHQWAPPSTRPARSP